MKSFLMIICFVSLLTLFSIICIIKFATEMNESDSPMKLVGSSMFPAELEFSKDLGVLRLRDNHSYIASHRFPYLAAITAAKPDQGWRFSCFGCAILRHWILTAAHCKKRDHAHRALLYSGFSRNRTETYSVVLWRLHEDYHLNSSLLQYDIAVAKVNVDLVPAVIPRAAGFSNKITRQAQASIWKTVLTMDRTTYLTNDLDIYSVDLVDPTRCYEQYGLSLDETLICVDMSKHHDCFVTEFGPIFARGSDRIVGVLTAVMPKYCERKLAIFINVSSYANWIGDVIRSEGENVDDLSALKVHLSHKVGTHS